MPGNLEQPMVLCAYYSSEMYSSERLKVKEYHTVPYCAYSARSRHQRLATRGCRRRLLRVRALDISTTTIFHLHSCLIRAADRR